MKTFFEHFLDEVQQKLNAGEVDEEKAQRWIAEIKKQLREYAEISPTAPIVQMPVGH
ncbi:MAG: hypothetical protein G01um101448_1203 [Parcubacteria group bacterium Gr01-1014_48]|nr:MAG: hypothetical protein G01um101448_1203 [Parcubacteria group bacterium Gr01-1014_48]